MSVWKKLKKGYKKAESYKKKWDEGAKKRQIASIERNERKYKALKSEEKLLRERQRISKLKRANAPKMDLDFGFGTGKKKKGKGFDIDFGF